MRIVHVWRVEGPILFVWIAAVSCSNVTFKTWSEHTFPAAVLQPEACSASDYFAWLSIWFLTILAKFFIMVVQCNGISLCTVWTYKTTESQLPVWIPSFHGLGPTDIYEEAQILGSGQLSLETGICIQNVLMLREAEAKGSNWPWSIKSCTSNSPVSFPRTVSAHGSPPCLGRGKNRSSAF